MTTLAARPAAPPPLVPLDADYDPAEAPEALRRGLLSDGRLDADESARMVRSGKRLARLRAMGPAELRRLFGVSSPRQLVEEAKARGELGYGWIQARKYLELADLPLQPFCGAGLRLGALRRIAALHRGAPGTDVQALVARSRAGEVLPLPPRRRPAPPRRLARPSRLAEQAERSVRRASEGLARLYGRVEAWDPGHDWARALDDGLRTLVQGYAARRGLAIGELWSERRGADRLAAGEEAGGPGGAGTGADRSGPDPAGSSGEMVKDPGELAAAPADPAAGTTVAADEPPWYVPMVRAVIALLDEEERARLDGDLLMALSGRSPAELLTFLRQVGRRLGDEALRDDLGGWVAGAAHGDLAERWPYLYNFFTTAQLPGFRLGLHSLRTVALPEGPRALLEAACAYWRLEEEADGEPVSGPAGAPRLSGELRFAAKRIQALLSSGAAVSVEPLSWLWAEAHDMKQELDALTRALGAAGE